MHVNTITDLIAAVRAMGDVLGHRPSPELAREIASEIIVEGGNDCTLSIDGEEWRVIDSEDIDQIMRDELEGDTYVLGCASSWFLADVLGMSTAAVEAIQNAECFGALGEMVLSMGKLGDYQQGIVRHYGYGPHFAHYDGAEHDIPEIDGRRYIAFRVD
jgi:hypothetical protein